MFQHGTQMTFDIGSHDILNDPQCPTKIIHFLGGVSHFQNVYAMKRSAIAKFKNIGSNNPVFNNEQKYDFILGVITQKQEGILTLCSIGKVTFEGPSQPTLF